jgi:hypothetical protein
MRQVSRIPLRCIRATTAYGLQLQLPSIRLSAKNNLHKQSALDSICHTVGMVMHADHFFRQQTRKNKKGAVDYGT